MDVVEAAAEALPLALLNAVNRELTARVSEQEQRVEAMARDITDQRKRLQFVREHTGNVRAEIVHTQAVAEGKAREVESVDGMRRLMERECGRLQQRQRQLRQREENLQEQVTVLETRLFAGNIRVEDFKAAMEFNQDELEQWDAARQQKEADELAVAQYTKQDEAKLKALRLQRERLEGSVRAKRQRLDDEVLAAHSVQTELDRAAAEYRRLHSDRGGLLQEWEQVVRAIAERDAAIRVAAEQYAEGADWLLTREAARKTLDDELDRVKEETEFIQYSIQQREKRANDLRNTVPALTQQVEEMTNEVEAMREQVSRAVRDKHGAVARLQDRDDAIEAKKRAIDALERRRDVAAARLNEETTSAADLEQQTSLVHRLLNDAERSDKTLGKEIEHLKKLQFGASQELHAARAQQDTLMADITGAQSQGKNYSAKIDQLDNEAFQQQGVLYNIEFSVQQMEKKVYRARGERSEEERKELLAKIDLLQSTLDELEKQHRVIELQVKRVREELRRAKQEIERLEGAKRKAQELTLEVELQCGHSDLEGKVLERKREDALVLADTMELELNRLRRQLQSRSDALHTLETRKQQLEAEVLERVAEIGVHQDRLRMEQKLAEDERRRLAVELNERLRSLTAVKNRHEILVGRLDPAQARQSQTQMVIDAAKEREVLQFRGDGLDARIKRTEREMRKLERTVTMLQSSNRQYKHRFDRVADDDDEVRTQRTLTDKFKELRAAMSRRALDANDYRATLAAKQADLQRLAVEREQADLTLNDLQREYQAASEEVLQAREAAVRYDQAIAKARTVVPEDVLHDIDLVEKKERLENAVGRLVQCAQRSGAQVYDSVRKELVQLQLPVGDALSVS